MPLETLTVDTLEKIVLDKCDNFITMQLWPSGNKLRFKKWLDNFKAEEKELALYLLNSFNYYNRDCGVAMLKSSIINLSISLNPQETILEQRDKWISFLAKTIFIPATGERRNITDSGQTLSSYIRRDLKIPEMQIMTVDDLYSSAMSGLLKSFDNVVFFDDLVGSGKQFIDMFTLDFEKETGLLMPIKEKCKELNLKPYYCFMVGTEYGIDRIKKECEGVTLSWAHILYPHHSPFHPNNIVWPERLKAQGVEFLKSASIRAGINLSEIKGYHDLGLTIAFEWTIPDCTLPIFSKDSSSWTALMEKL